MLLTLKPVRDQVIVVFGANSGIGRAAALRFAQRGARVVVSGRSAEPLEELVKEIRESGGRAVFVAAEVTHPEQVKRAAETAVELYGGLDTWVHLAGIYSVAPFEQVTPEEFRRIIDVNLNGAAFGAMAALPHLKSQGGALVFISSIEAWVGLPYQAAYAASKHGMKGLLDVLRLELRKEGAPVSVTNVMPASINTPLFAKTRTKIGVKPKGLPPYYDPEVVVDAIEYAASNPVRDMYAGGAARAFNLMHRLSPAVTDSYLLAFGFGSQRTDEPKTDAAPDNLFDHAQGLDRIRGEFGGRRTSVYTSLATNRAAQGLLAGFGIGAASFLAALTLLRSR
jgi:NAD(P)-dependent dehydrogenase (short-subunit alcohol dehydrogenase family)